MGGESDISIVAVDDRSNLNYRRLSAEDGDGDDLRLQQLGYKQELSRSLSALSNFAVTFSIVSILTGLSTMFGTGLSYGGPVTMVYGWPIVGLMTMLVGSSMAEICSAYPTSGGLYYWSARLSGSDWGPAASWFTGWRIVRGIYIYSAGSAFLTHPSMLEKELKSHVH